MEGLAAEPAYRPLWTLTLILKGLTSKQLQKFYANKFSLSTLFMYKYEGTFRHFFTIRTSNFFLMIRMSKLFKLIHYTCTHQIGTCRLLSYTYRYISAHRYEIAGNLWYTFGPIPKLFLVLSYQGILKYWTDLVAESEPWMSNVAGGYHFWRRFRFLERLSWNDST